MSRQFPRRVAARAHSGARMWVLAAVALWVLVAASVWPGMAWAEDEPTTTAPQSGTVEPAPAPTTPPLRPVKGFPVRSLPIGYDADADLTCDYAAPGRGTLTDKLCWINFSVPQAQDTSPSPGQTPNALPLVLGTRHVMLPDQRTRITFTLGAQGQVPEAADGWMVETVPAWNYYDSESHSWGGSFLGRYEWDGDDYEPGVHDAGYYRGIKGYPAITMDGLAQATVSLDDIRLERKDAGGAWQSVQGADFSVVVADAESTDSPERIRIQTTGADLEPIRNTTDAGAQADPWWGDGCTPRSETPGDDQSYVIGQVAQCVPSSAGGGHSGAMMVAAHSPSDSGSGPWNVTGVMESTGGAQSIALAIMVRGIMIDAQFGEPGGIAGDTLSTAIIRKTGAYSGDLVADSADSGQTAISDWPLSTTDEITYLIGERIVGADGTSRAPSDYFRTWSGPPAEGVPLKLSSLHCLDMGSGRQVPVTREVGLFGWTVNAPAGWEPDSNAVFTEVTVPVNAMVSCLITNTPNSLTVANRVEGVEPAASSFLSADSWTAAADGTPLTWTADQSGTSATAEVPLRSGPHTLTIAEGGAAAGNVRYTHTRWDADETPSGVVQDALTFTARAFDPRSSTNDVPPSPLHATSVYTFIPGEATWSKVDEAGEALGGSTWTLTRDDDPTWSRTITDCTADSAADCAAPDGDRDPAAGSFLVRDLPDGTYTAHETGTPVGYWPDPSAGGSLGALDLTHARIGLDQPVVNHLARQLTIRKVAGLPSGTDAGAGSGGQASFAIWATDPSGPDPGSPLIGNLTTDPDTGLRDFPVLGADGTALLTPGRTYWLQETSPLGGHTSLPAPQPFSVRTAQRDGQDLPGVLEFVLPDDAAGHPLVATAQAPVTGMAGATAASVLVIGNVPPVTLPAAGGPGSAALILGGLALVALGAAGYATTVRHRPSDGRG